MKPTDQQPQQINVDLNQAEDVVCERCGNYTFQEAVLIKKLSPIISPTGREALVPIPVFTCNACGNINQRFLPSYMHEQETSSPTLRLEK